MADISPKGLAVQLLAILHNDLPRLRRIDDYIHGRHDSPYMPDNADTEYHLLAQRSVSNWIPLLIDTPAQALYVDGFRRGRGDVLSPVTPSEARREAAVRDMTPEWAHWQFSRLDNRQAAVYRGAIGYGHSFTVTEKDSQGRVTTRGLSPLRTAALFEDPANDNTPYAALTVTRWPVADAARGKARMWANGMEYEVTFTSMTDPTSVYVTEKAPYSSEECPVTRFAMMVDLDGRTTGVVEPVIPLQNRINQTVFDLLVAQTYGSFKVRTITGMAPPMLMEPVYDELTGEIVGSKPKIDPNTGQPIPANVNLSARRALFAEDPDTRFDTLDETPLDGYIASIDMSIRHLSAVSQTPPHHLLGQIANLSAEALQAAETALSRKIEEFRHSFGESWERVFRLAAEMSGVEGADDYSGEVIWRDMEQRSLSRSADALGKLAESLGIPKRGLWHRVPGATQTEILEWEELYESENADLALAEALYRAAPTRATLTSPAAEDDPEAA